MINDTVQVVTYASELLGSFDKVTLLGEVTYTVATNMGHDVVADYMNIVNDIPEELRVNVTEDIFYLISTTEGKIKAIGKSWLEQPLSIVSTGNTQLVVDSQDLSRIKAALAYEGINVLSHKSLDS